MDGKYINLSIIRPENHISKIESIFILKKIVEKNYLCCAFNKIARVLFSQKHIL